MRPYAIRRFLVILPTLLVLAFGIMALASLATGDPAQQYAQLHSSTGQPTSAEVAQARHQLHLDQPFLVQYASWVTRAVHGNLGQSFSLQQPVASEIATHLWPTTELALAAMALTVVLAIPLGTVAAMRHGSWADHGLRVGSLLGASVPGFFLAYILIELFATRLRLLPVAGTSGLGIVLPAVTLASGGIATASRLLRASLLEVLGEPFVRTARAKGLSRIRW